MQYVSTRGNAPDVSFPDVMLAGLAPDGGLYLPESWPQVATRFDGSPDYAEVLAGCLIPYVGPSITAETLFAIAADSTKEFPQPEVVPLREVGTNLFLLELFWGPSLAFKDLGLQVLARLFEAVGNPVTIIGATSGDTGAAAIQAFRGRKGVAIVILHPDGRISEVQRRQMTAVDEANVVNLAVEGTFDDCQALAKRLLADEALRSETNVASANSINWFRIAAQAAYYAAATLRIGALVDVSVPSGNFGNAFSGYVAKRMGFAVEDIVVATNINRGLADLLTEGTLRARTAVSTISPAMDIQVPSNLERALFEAMARRSDQRTGAMSALAATGQLQVTEDQLSALRQTYSGQAVTEEETAAEMGYFHQEHGRLIDPHTAVGLSAARRNRSPNRPMLVLGTAHPAKFPETVGRATGVVPALPERFADLFEQPERLTHVRNDYQHVRQLVLDAAQQTRV